MNSMADCSETVLALVEMHEEKRKKVSYISADGVFHFDKKLFKSIFKPIARLEYQALALCLARHKDIRVSARIASSLKALGSKQVTKILLAEYPHCTIQKKQLIIEVLSSLRDQRLRHFFRREWLNQELDRYARCHAYEALATLYAWKKKRSMLIELIGSGLQQEPHLQLAALAKSCFLGEASFPDHLIARMAEIPVIVSEVRAQENNWLFSKIRQRADLAL